MISLDKPFKKFKPDPFPLKTANVALVCPFWADVDLCRGGRLWSRETADSALLHKASQDSEHILYIVNCTLIILLSLFQ